MTAKNGNALPSIDRVAELLSYDSDCGVLTWRIDRGGKAKAGSVAGSVDGKGYGQVKIDGLCLRAHRVAWCLFYGAWPAAEIDHINGIRNDNRIINLRETTSAQNKQNIRGAHRDNKSGHLGVCYRHKRNLWTAQIKAEGRIRHLGFFSTPEAASEAYLSAKARLHPFQTIRVREVIEP